MRKIELGGRLSRLEKRDITKGMGEGENKREREKLRLKL